MGYFCEKRAKAKYISIEYKKISHYTDDFLHLYQKSQKWSQRFAISFPIFSLKCSRYKVSKNA